MFTIYWLNCSVSGEFNSWAEQSVMGRFGTFIANSLITELSKANRGQWPDTFQKLLAYAELLIHFYPATSRSISIAVSDNVIGRLPHQRYPSRR